MVREMVVYDFNGRRTSVKKNGEDGEKLRLPPVVTSNQRDKMRNDMHRKEQEKFEEDSLILDDEDDEEIEENDKGKQKGSIEEITHNNSDRRKVEETREMKGFLTEGVLSRRNMSGPSSRMFFPQIAPKANSIISARSEPPWYDYSRDIARGRRLVYERNFPLDGNFRRNSRIRKQTPSDKLITFYHDHESTEPQLRILVSEQRFRNLNHLLSDLIGLTDLSEHERFIHSPHGLIIGHLSEFDDGGVYFFGPPYMYDVHDYLRFRRLNTPELLDTEFDGYDDRDLLPKVKETKGNIGSMRKRKIRIVSNFDRSRVLPFVIDELRHKSIHQVLQDLTEVVLPYDGHVQKLCSRRGKTVQSINEMFQISDDLFVAVCTNTPSYNYNEYAYPSYQDPYYQPRWSGGRLPQLNYYERERSMLRPYEVCIMDKTFVFEPPTVRYSDSYPQRIDVPPFENLEMDWVYGYNGKNCRNNVYVLPSEELLYFVAKIVLIHDVSAKRQRFYAEHTDEIRCIAQHPNSWIFASGQISGDVGQNLGHIRIWDSKCLVTLNVISLHQMDLSVECLAFSQDDDGVKLASIATSGDDWFTYVFDWEEGILLSKSDPFNQITLACLFDPTDNRKLVSCGKGHVFFWNVSGKHATNMEGEFFNHRKFEYVTCMGFNSKNELVTADSSAYVHIWNMFEQKTASIIKTTHTGSIITMVILPGCHIITGSGSDRTLTLLNYDHMVPTMKKVQLDEENGGIVAIAPVSANINEADFEDLTLTIGTSMNDIMIGSLTEGFQCILNGAAEQMTALATNPTSDTFLTAGMDAFIILWSTKQHDAIWEIKAEEPCCAADFYPTGDCVVVGTASGKCMVLNLSDSSKTAEFEAGRSAITCLSYSPTGKYLAVGSESGFVGLHQCYDGGKSYRFLNNIKTWGDSISSMDWSVDDRYLRIVTSTFTYEIWDVDRRSEERNRSVMRNLHLNRETMALSYHTAGIWNTSEKDLMFRTCNKTENDALLCAGTNNGSVRLYNYPCDTKLALYNEKNVHSGNISNVSFLAHDRFLISTGESDYCIIQWRLAYQDPMKEDRVSERRSYGYYQNGAPTLTQRRMSKYAPNGAKLSSRASKKD